MPRLYKKRILVNVIGTFFYMICILQWLWSTLPYLPEIIRFVGTLQPAVTPTKPIKQAIVSGQMSVASIIVVTLITILVISATVYVLVKLPTAIGKTGAKLTSSASNYIVPVISHHEKLTPKKRQWLTARIIFDIKLALCIIPVPIVASSYFMSSSLPYDLTIFVGAVLSMIAIVLLWTQILLAKCLRVNLDQVW